jgi:hypothetical protein
MKRYKGNSWTDKENELLQEYYYTCSRGTLRIIFEGRSMKEIDNQAFKLKRKNKPFKSPESNWEQVKQEAPHLWE